MGFPTLKNFEVKRWVGETTVRLPWGKGRDRGTHPRDPRGVTERSEGRLCSQGCREEGVKGGFAPRGVGGRSEGRFSSQGRRGLGVKGGLAPRGAWGKE